MEIGSLNLSASAVPASSAPLVSGVESVGFAKRAGARIVDLVIHFGVALVAGAVVAVAGVILEAVGVMTEGETMLRIENEGFLGTVVALFGYVAFHAICEGLYGSTPGKFALGMVVLSEDGQRCTYGQALSRSFAFLIDGLFLGLVAYASMKNSPRDQRYGDRWAETVVVERKSAPAGTLRPPLRFVGVVFVALFADAVALAVATLL